MYLTENETKKYIDVLDQLVHSYNIRPHRSIGQLSPNEAELDDNRMQALNALNKRYTTAVRQRGKPVKKFNVDDIVRLKFIGERFARGYNQQYTTELFKIESIENRLPITTYVVRSMDTDDVIMGSFYPAELQLVTNDNVFKVERVLAQRVRNGRRQQLVKWEGFGNRHNSWNNVTDIVNTY